VAHVDDRILPTIKKLLGLDENYEAFDVDIMMHINSALGTLTQLGIGPPDGFMIEDADATWASFLGTNFAMNPVKTYVWLRVRLLFDPPATSFLIESYTKQAQELEWRINVLREGTEWVPATV
jgi:hypothetical protein